MDVSTVNELKILSNVRLVGLSEGFVQSSSNNLHVQFSLSGEIQGTVTCYLCLDEHELGPTEKNYIFPLFVESMNILIGRQLSQDTNLKNYKIKLSPPKLSMISKDILYRLGTQCYELELEGFTFSILTDYRFEVIS